MIGFGDPVFQPGSGQCRRPRSRSGMAARSVTTAAYTDFWQGAGVDRGKLAQALRNCRTPPTNSTRSRTASVSRRAIFISAPMPAKPRSSARRSPTTASSISPPMAGRRRRQGSCRTFAGAQHSQQPSDLDDGLLTSSEVAQLKLNADWVVLSACNTIAGDKPGAEALSGLARSFFYAGHAHCWFRIGRSLRKRRPG